MSDLISVIIPVYNISEYIGTCLNSVINQNYSNIEIIIVNDGSTDSSGDICKSYLRKDGRIRYIEQENQGSVVARQVGLDNSNGKYIIFIDADDYIEYNLVKNMYEYIKKYDVDFVHANCIENGKNNNCIKHNVFFENLNFENRKDIISKNVFGINVNGFDNIIEPSIHAKIFKEDFIKKCFSKLPRKQQYGEDLICLCYMILGCKSMLLINDAYYNYRIREGSLSHTLDEYLAINNELSLFRCLMDVFGVEGFDERFKNEIKRKYINKIIISLENAFPDLLDCYKRYINIIPDEFIGKKIIIYGAGSAGKNVYKQLSEVSKIKIVAWVDKKLEGSKSELYNVNIVGIKSIDDCEYDYVLIAVEQKKLADEIKNELIEYGIKPEKIIWKDMSYKTYLVL